MYKLKNALRAVFKTKHSFVKTKHFPIMSTTDLSKRDLHFTDFHVLSTEVSGC